MNARQLIEAEDPKRTFRQAKAANPHRVALDYIFAEYGTSDVDEIYLEASSLRSGTEHEEDVIGNRPWCKVCGWCDDGHPDPRYHPEFYLAFV